MDFTGFLGNDAVKARLSGAFASGRVAHSYLICGPVGSGKHTLTRILCAAMQCEGRGEKIPCGVCSGCRKALEGVHPDIITVDDPEHKSMTVEPIRAAYLRAGGFLGQVLTLLQDAEDEPFVRQFAAAYAAHDRMALLRVLLPMEKAKREQLLPALQQLRACICGALTQRGGLDTASESAAQIVASRSGSELLQASDSIQAAIDALTANASAGAVTGYLAMKLR